jgi:mRNA-degrading endonuclease toxin of MazEF toxin-antitoxin module
MSSGLRRGEIYRVRQPQHGDPKKSRCFAVVSRQDLLDSKANRVLCAPINTSGVDLSTEVQVAERGLKRVEVFKFSKLDDTEPCHERDLCI